ncbi:MAG: hypothetical protein V7L05_34115 [Nostoc sp.]|uniref:hypothetical protein n=1 Tax=Nostoc sp. TaxID=1180 RepID=UPI002FF94571
MLSEESYFFIQNGLNAPLPLTELFCPMPNAQFNKLTSINGNSLVKSVSVILLSSTY